MINQDSLTDREFDLIDQIVNRTMRLNPNIGTAHYFNIFMSIQCVHQEIVPLDLEGLATASNFNLSHDVAGIINHLNVTKNQPRELKNGFNPRFAKVEGGLDVYV